MCRGDVLVAPEEITMNTDYYAKKLSAHRLMRVYEIAPPRARQYLRAEIDHVLSKIAVNDTVLELGCGFGRVLLPLSRKAQKTVGIDNAMDTLKLARHYCKDQNNIDLYCTAAEDLALTDNIFDVVACVQNGLSAFHVDPVTLFAEAVRVTRPGGIVLFSSYSARFWDHRREWFELQSREGLLGEIDYDKTGNGKVVCKDGFTATTFGESEFKAIAAKLHLNITLTEVDESSLFCEVRV